MNSFRYIKEALVCLLLFLLSANLFGQKKEANNWYWGYYAGLTFNYTPPKPLFDSRSFHSRSNASISDSTGKLLFYTNGDSLFRNNAKAVYITNKIGLPIGASHRASLIIPDAQNRKKYWVGVLSTTINALMTFPVDMELDGGKGNIDTAGVQKTGIMLSSTLSVMQHADGNRNWLIGRRYGTDSLLAWLVDTVVHHTPVASKMFSRYPDYPNLSTAQVCKSSPNSEILFWGWGQRETRCNQLIKIDRQTGKFYGLIHLVDSVSLNPRYIHEIFPVDAAFSPDNRYLYTVENTYKYPLDSLPQNQSFNRIFFTVRQYDLSVWDSAAIKNSGRVVFQAGPYPFIGVNSTGPMTCQLGPDGKIYFQEFNQTKLSVMHCPNSPAPNVNFKFREINIQRKGGLRMPTLNQTFVRNAGIFQVQANKRKLCQGDTLELSGYGAGAEHFIWIVSPALPASVKVDTLTWQKISTATIPAGSYTFTCQSFSRCSDVFEKSIVVEVLSLPLKPLLVVQQKPVPCLGDSAIIKVQSPVSGNHYFWSTGDSTSSIVVKQTGLVSMDSVSNAVGCGIKVGDTVAVSIKNAIVPPVPVILGPKMIEICEGKQAKLTVDSVQLTVKYKWSNGQMGDSISVGSGKFTVYSETAEGCRSGSSDTVRVVSVPLPVVQIVAMDSVRCQANAEEKSYQLIMENVQLKTIEIQGGELMSHTDSTVTVRWLEGTPTMAAEIKIKSFNRLNCEGPTVSFRPKSDLEICRSLYPLGIPNLITLNHDGKNDLWELANLYYFQPVSLSIYNRWGKLIFETSDYRNNWPEEGLEAGTYFYRMGVSGEGNSNTGWIEVVK